VRDDRPHERGPLPHEPVEVRRFDTIVAQRADRIGPLVVGDDQQDVGRAAFVIVIRAKRRLQDKNQRDHRENQSRQTQKDGGSVFGFFCSAHFYSLDR
ncbi:MAG TPA: hypothetical protein VN699_11455, partial [Pirellulales bacterium]|nr:hypothetical protein [Pirellulales bacterium]